MTRPTVLAYYFPDWHGDPRNARWFGDGWDEWRLLRSARPRFPGHRQPREPLRGYEDESDPVVAGEQMQLALDSGIDGFLVDYYWYDDGDYLSGALDRGLLGTEQAAELKIALMWANHELVDIFPSAAPDTAHATLKRGAIDRAAFERMVHHIVDRYFSSPRYLRVDGKPWFSLYEIGSLLEGLGGVDEAVDALTWFRQVVRDAGHPGLHLDAVVWGFGVLPTAVVVESPSALISTLGFDSATSYVWIHHTDVGAHRFPAGDWADVRRDAYRDYERYARELPVPFHPNVTVGWDSSPRTAQDRPFQRGGYPWIPTWDPDPAQFREGLEDAARFLREHPTEHPVLTINAWNEWTEGSALLPDTHHGMGFLEAVRSVFGPRN
jgi:hypothetical protein